MKKKSENAHTIKQFTDFFDEAIEEAQNPDPREAQKKKRKARSIKVSKKFGL